jgi:hypothetical protein
MEVNPRKPSSSWVAWEVSRVRRDAGSEEGRAAAPEKPTGKSGY